MKEDVQIAADERDNDLDVKRREMEAYEVELRGLTMIEASVPKSKRDITSVHTVMSTQQNEGGSLPPLIAVNLRKNISVLIKEFTNSVGNSTIASEILQQALIQGEVSLYYLILFVEE